MRVPGAFEIPVTALRAAETGQFDAVICIGCVIKGETMHFEYIAGSVCQAIADAASATGVPMALGVLTTLTEEQAAARAADGPENKGREAALAAVEMATLFRQLQQGVGATARDGVTTRTERRTSPRLGKEPRHRAREAAVQMLYQWEVGRSSHRRGADHVLAA